jgi:acyl-CoA synthetase (AMP-forming)/AMP-acid ligase II
MLRRTNTGWVLPDAGVRAQEYLSSGEWISESLHEIVLRRLGEDPDHLAVIDDRVRMTRSALYSEALRLGSALVGRGLAPGSVVSFQLPNWHEACVIGLASALYGFVLNPLLPMYREHELSFILSQCRCDALFIPSSFRNTDFEALIARVDFETKREDRIFRVRSGREDVPTFEALLSEGDDIVDPPAVNNADVKIVIYTSGSTGRPKGVLHSHHTLHAFVQEGARFWGINGADRLFVPSPVGHVGGSIYAFEMPWFAGATAILADTWDAEQAVDVIEAEGATFFAGATPFLQGLLDAAFARGSHLPTLRRFVCGGASVPISLIARAQDHFRNAVISRAYGSSEVPIICPGISTRDDAIFGQTTDGEIRADVMIAGPDGRPVDPGESGEILARSSRMFLGYIDTDDEAGQFAADGYFAMGDVGRRIDGRFLEITGRKKEIIIRHGENISPREIENALLSHEAISSAAVVGVPHPRTGERAVAFVVLKPEKVFSMEAMRSFLSDFGMARQKFPEELHIMDRLPTNSIGKILKEQLKASLVQPARPDAGSEEASQ